MNMIMKANVLPAMGLKIVFSSILLLLIVAGCIKKDEKLPQGEQRIEEPYQEFGSSVLYSYDGPHKQLKLETEYMRKGLSDTATILVVPVKLTLYDSTGDEGSHVLADSGFTTARRDSFYIWGDVFVKTDEGMVIRSESLWWNQQTAKIGSEDFVQIITSGGDVLRGRGLDANESFSRWSLKQSVTGEFPNFKRQFDEDDDF
ncbi:MAG: LPS export ABC transporter periplasmic protein LptC [Chitinivibrionales bacterium]